MKANILFLVLAFVIGLTIGHCYTEKTNQTDFQFLSTYNIFNINKLDNGDFLVFNEDGEFQRTKNTFTDALKLIEYMSLRDANIQLASNYAFWAQTAYDSVVVFDCEFKPIDTLYFPIYE